jgi:hypothetical protein
MSLTIFASLVVGVPVYEAFETRTTSVTEPRFNPRTGLPAAPATITTSRYFLFGHEVDSDTHGDWEFDSPLHGTGLKVFTSGDHLPDERIIGEAVASSGYESGIFLVDPLELSRVEQRVCSALQTLGSPLIARMFLVQYIGY